MSDKPNVILILTDDQGAWAMGCAGNSEIRTPNLDRLAETGIRFENFFCASPVCSPARASILTGRIPSQHGIHDWICGGNSKAENCRVIDGIITWQYPKDSPPNENIEYLKGMPGYTDLLAANGYTCGLSGKWHMGDADTPQKSYSFWNAHCLGGGAYYHAPFADAKGEITYKKGEYVTEVTTDYALDFLNLQKGSEKPFCLSVCYTAPHSPWDRDNHPKETWDEYHENCPFESVPDIERHPWAGHLFPDSPEKRKEHLSGYFTAITEMDKGVGQILDWLEENGLREDTLVIFTADNGMSMGHHGVYGKGNGTFPLNMYDSSVKVPALISRPGSVPEGKAVTDLLSHYDIFPTLCEYTGTENKEADTLPGKSFAPLLNGEELQGRENVVVHDEYGPVRMIRDHEYKYVHRYPYGPCEFYDLKNDPDETVNLLNKGTHTGLIQKYKGRLDEWFDRYVNPALDGTHEGVTGAGQYGLAGPAGKGGGAFAGNMQFSDGKKMNRGKSFDFQTPW